MSALSTAVGGPPLLRQPLVTHFSYLFLLLAGKRCLRFPKGVLRGALGSSGKKKTLRPVATPNVTAGLIASFIVPLDEFALSCFFFSVEILTFIVAIGSIRKLFKHRYPALTAVYFLTFEVH